MQCNADCEVPGSYVYTPGLDAILDIGEHQLDVTLHPFDSNNYESVVSTTTILVEKASPMVSWAQPADIYYGSPLTNIQCRADCSLKGTYRYDPAIGDVLDAGIHMLAVSFVPDDDNFQSVEANVPLVVMKAIPIIRWSQPAKIAFGTLLSGLLLL